MHSFPTRRESKCVGSTQLAGQQVVLQMHDTCMEQFYVTARFTLYAYTEMALTDVGSHLTHVRQLVATFLLSTLWYIKHAGIPGNFCLALALRTWLEDIILTIHGFCYSHPTKFDGCCGEETGSILKLKQIWICQPDDTTFLHYLLLPDIRIHTFQNNAFGGPGFNFPSEGFAGLDFPSLEVECWT